jgi:hypothetical protein
MESGNLHHNKNLAQVHGVRFPSCLSLRKNAGTPEEKAENPNYRGTRD